MVKTQIQLPDRLYREAKRVAAKRELSLAEVLRRGVEYIARVYPPLTAEAGGGLATAQGGADEIAAGPYACVLARFGGRGCGTASGAAPQVGRSRYGGVMLSANPCFAPESKLAAGRARLRDGRCLGQGEARSVRAAARHRHPD